MNRCQTFRRDFPVKYLQDVLIGLFEDYLSAAEFCLDRFEPTEAVNVLPFYRRGMIEGRLRDCARPHRLMDVTCSRDASGFWYHTVVHAGDCVMTQSTTRHSDEVVRSSLSRLAYAEPSNQLYFDPSFEPATENLRGFIYGILIHGREPRERFFPAFAQVVFPRRNLESYYSQRIDLFAEFPEVVRLCTSGIFDERHTTLERQFEEIDVPDPELRDEFGESI